MRKNKKKLIELDDKVFSIEANIMNWQDAWVKVSNSYLKWNDKLTKLEEKHESLNKDFIKLINLIKNSLGGEKGELEKDLNAIGIYPVKASGDEKDKCKECGGFRMGENIQIHNDGCSQCTTTTTGDTLPELIGIKHDPNYLNQFTDIDDSELLTEAPKIESKPEKNCTTCEFVYSPPPSPCATCKEFSNWSPSKRLDIINIDKLGEKAKKIRKKYPNFNDYILKFMKAGEEVMQKGFTKEDGYKVMKEAIELCNPNKDVLNAEKYMNNMSNELMTFMDNCFDYIISDYELNKGKKSLIKTQYEKQMKRQ